MKCTIPGVNLKVFGRAIQSLSKIGDELYFEPQEDGLFLRTVNSCRSAYGCFQFSPSFFSHYVDSPGQHGPNVERDGGSEEEEGLRCKLGMKSVMTVFRNLSSIDRSVEKCCISLDLKDARLTFLLYCRHGMVKTHNLTFIECETLQAVFSKDLSPNKLTAPPKVLCDAVVNFQSNQEEITLIVHPSSVALKNYVEDEPDPKKVIHTEMTLSPDEFDNYQVGVDTSITFCLKELRAILAFADMTNLPISLHFESAGRPVTFSITSDLSFEANFVLATLAEVDSSQAPQTQQLSQRASTSKKNAGKSSRSRAQTIGHMSQSRSQPGERPNHSKHTSDKHTQPSKQSNKQLSEERPKHQSAEMDMDDGDDDELAQAMMDAAEMEENIITDQTLNQSRLLPGASNPPTNVGPRHVSQREHLEQQEGEEEEMEVPRLAKNNSHVRKNRSSPNLMSSLTVINNNEKHGNDEEDENFDDLHSYMEKSGMGAALTSGGSHNLNSPQQTVKQSSQRSSGSSSQSQVIPVLGQQKAYQSPVQELDEEDDDELDETIPGTPPSKKFRSVFFGTQSSTQPTQSQSRSIVLAPNSDDES